MTEFELDISMNDPHGIQPHDAEGIEIPDHYHPAITLYPCQGTACSMDEHDAIHHGPDRFGHRSDFRFGEANGDRIWVAEDGKYHRGTIGGSGPDMGLGGLV